MAHITPSYRLLDFVTDILMEDFAYEIKVDTGKCVYSREIQASWQATQGEGALGGARGWRGFGHRRSRGLSQVLS